MYSSITFQKEGNSGRSQYEITPRGDRSLFKCFQEDFDYLFGLDGTGETLSLEETNTMLVLADGNYEELRELFAAGQKRRQKGNGAKGVGSCILTFAHAFLVKAGAPIRLVVKEL